MSVPKVIVHPLPILVLLPMTDIGLMIELLYIRQPSLIIASWLIVVFAVIIHPLPIVALGSITAWGNIIVPSLIEA